MTGHETGPFELDALPCSVAQGSVSAPDWRHQEAQRLAREGRQALVDHAELAIRRAAALLRAQFHGQAAMPTKNALRQSLELASAAFVEQASLIESLALSGLRAKHIAERINADAEVVALYLHLFFDLDPRAVSEHIVWEMAIGSEFRRGEPATRGARASRKIIAYLGSAVLLDRIYGFTTTPAKSLEFLSEKLNRRALIREFEILAPLCVESGLAFAPASREVLDRFIERLATYHQEYRHDMVAKTGLAADLTRDAARHGSTPLSPPKGASPKIKKKNPLIALNERAAKYRARRAVLRKVGDWLTTDGREHNQACFLEVDARKHSELLETGCFETSSAGKVALRQSITAVKFEGVVFRTAKGGVSAIATSDHPASAATLMELLLTGDDIAQRLMNWHGAFIVTLDAAQAAVWHALGFGAAPVAELGSCRHEQLNEIVNALVVVEPVDIPGAPDLVDAHSARKIIRRDVILVAPGWNVLTGKPHPEQSRRQLEALCLRIFNHKPDAWGGVASWDPPSELCERLRGNGSSKGKAELHESMLTSLRKDLALLPRPIAPNEAVEEAADWATARQRLIQVASGSGNLGGSAPIGAARKSYLAAGEEQFIRPLIEQCGLARSAKESMLLHSAAALRRRYLELEADDLVESAQRCARPTTEDVARNDEMRRLEKQILEMVASLPSHRSRRERRSKPHAPK
jgi:hypothetical protein